MELHVDSDRVVDGFVTRITLPGGDRFERIRATAGTIQVTSDGARSLLVQLRQRNGWSLRDHRGHALAQITLRWRTDAASAVGWQTGGAQLRMVDDFSLLRSAVRSLADAAIARQPWVWSTWRRTRRGGVVMRLICRSRCLKRPLN
ncbi:MAG: hypothetical protein ACI9DC_003651 [Gammaproteobacteria bacterium]|jgi:hypothetical protein